MLIRINKDDWPARHLKAAALRKIGYAQTSSSPRGSYSSGALEIEGAFDSLALQRLIAEQVLDPAMLPSEGLFTLLRYRINPQGAYGKTVSVGYRFNDPYEDFALILRDGILEAIPRRTKPVEARVEVTRKQFDAIFAGSRSHERAASLGACITGAGRAIATLFAVFDRPDEQPVPNTALR